MNTLDVIIEESDAGDNITVRQYLVELLVALWDEKESFSGKRPFGNSGWEYELYKPLIKSGLVEGKLDEYGDIHEVNERQAHIVISDAICSLYEGAK